MSVTNDPHATGSSLTIDLGKDSVTGNNAPKVYLAEPSGGTFITPMQQTGGSVTALNSGALVTPSSVLTRPSSAITATVTFTLASPTTFTWTSNPLVNGQGVALTGSVPSGANANQVYFVVNVSGNTFQLSTTVGGAANVNASASGSCTATLFYFNGSLIASATAAGSIVVPNFSSTALGDLIDRIRVFSSITSGWNGINLSIDLWSAAPTFSTGDGTTYTPATGSSSWLANFLVGLTQAGDGAYGSGPLTSGSQAMFKFGAIQNVWWSLQILTQVAPAVSQTFTIIPEMMN